MYAAYFPGLLLDLKNGDDMFLQNIGFQIAWYYEYTLEDSTLQIKTPGL
jgi:hypothetical protein